MEHLLLEQRLVEAYLRNAGRLYSFCRRQLSDRATAEDVVQESFLRTCEYLQAGNEIGDIRVFLYRVASNLIIDEWRRRGRRRNVSLDELCERGADPTYEATDDAHGRLDAYTALRGLEKEECELLTLRYIKGRQVMDIASDMKLTPNTVAVRLHRATRRLAQSFLMRSWRASTDMLPSESR